MARLWIYFLGSLLLCFDRSIANHLSRNRTLTREQLLRQRTLLPGNAASIQRDRGSPNGRVGIPAGGGIVDPRTGATLSQRDIDRVILTPVQDGAVRSLRNLLSTRRGRGNPRLIGFLIPRADGRTQLRLMRDNRGNRVNVNELPFNIRTIVAAARRANLLPSGNGTRGFQQSRRIATVGGLGGQEGGPNNQLPSEPDTGGGGGETIKQRTVNIEVNVQSPDAPAPSSSPGNPNPPADNPGMMNPGLLNQQSRFMNNMGAGTGFNPMINQRQRPGLNAMNGFRGFPSSANNNRNNNNRQADDTSSSSSGSSNSGGGNINIGLGIGMGSSSPVVPPKPASTKTPASEQLGGRGMVNMARNVQPTPPNPFQQGGRNPFDQTGFPGISQTGFPPMDQSGFPANTQLSFPSNPQTGFPPSNQFQANSNNPPSPTLQRFDQQPPAMPGSIPASNSMPWNTFQSNSGNFGQDTGSLANTNPFMNNNQIIFANNMQRSNFNGMQFQRNVPQRSNGIVQTQFNPMQSPQFNNLASNQNFANSPVLTPQASSGVMGIQAGGFDSTRQIPNLPNGGNSFDQGPFGASEPTIGEPMIIDNGGRTTVVVDNITFTGLLPPGPPVLKTQVINGKGSVHINPVVSSQSATNSLGTNFPSQLHFTNPNDINSLNQNFHMTADSNQLFQNQELLGLQGTQGTKSPVEPQMNQDTSFGTPSIFVNTSVLLNLTNSQSSVDMSKFNNTSTLFVSNSTNHPPMLDISIPLNTNPVSLSSSNVDTNLAGGSLVVDGGKVSSLDLTATATTDVPGLLNMATVDPIGHVGGKPVSDIHVASVQPHTLMTSTVPSVNLQSLSTTMEPLTIMNDPHWPAVESIAQNPAGIPSPVTENLTIPSGIMPNTVVQPQEPSVVGADPQFLKMQRQRQILHLHRLALLKRREEQLNTLRKQLLHMELTGGQRQPVQRNPLTAEKTKDIRILKNIKQGATAPQTTAQSAVAFMNVDSLRSLIEEVLHGFFKKQNIIPTNLPLSTGRSVSSAVLDAVTGISPNPIEFPPKATNLLQLNISGVHLGTSLPVVQSTTTATVVPTSFPPVVDLVGNVADPNLIPTEPTPPAVTDPNAAPPVTDPAPALVTDPNAVPFTDPNPAHITGPTVTPVTGVTDPTAIPAVDPHTASVTDPSVHAADLHHISVTGVPVTKAQTGHVFFTTTVPPSTTHHISSSTSVIMDSVGNSVGQPSLSGQTHNMFPGGIAVHPELSTIRMAHARNLLQTTPPGRGWGFNLPRRGVQLPGRARGVVSSIPEMIGGGLSSTNARVITHHHRPLDSSNFNLQINRRLQDVAMTPNRNIPIGQPGGVPVFPML
ncbi:uncharacterized protein LOC111112803 isoform X2 [Crassostrea virginica]